MRVEIPLDDKAFRYFNAETNTWETEGGVYQVMAAANVQDIRLTAAVTVEGTSTPLPAGQSGIAAYEQAAVRNVSDGDFRALLGREIPPAFWDQEKGLELNDALCQMSYAKSRFARLVFRILDRLLKDSMKKETPDLNLMFIYNVPFRGIAKMSNGMVTMEMAEAMVEAVNGRFFRGVGHLIRGFIKNEREKKRRRQA